MQNPDKTRIAEESIGAERKRLVALGWEEDEALAQAKMWWLFSQERAALINTRATWGFSEMMRERL
jgi:hypothetical protein